jgi:IS5 family transposase
MRENASRHNRLKNGTSNTRGIEGSISQGVRAFGLHRARYWGQAKTHLQHVAIAVAMNLVRLGADSPVVSLAKLENRSLPGQWRR